MKGGGTVVQMFGDAGGFFRRMAILYPDLHGQEYPARRIPGAKPLEG